MDRLPDPHSLYVPPADKFGAIRASPTVLVKPMQTTPSGNHHSLPELAHNLSYLAASGRVVLADFSATSNIQHTKERASWLSDKTCELFFARDEPGINPYAARRESLIAGHV